MAKKPDNKQLTNIPWKAAEAYGGYRGSMFDFITTEKIADEITIDGMQDELEQKMELTVNTPAELVPIIDKILARRQTNRNKERGIQIASKLAGDKGNILEERQEGLLGRRSSYWIGNREMTDADFIALDKLYTDQYYGYLLGLEGAEDFKEFEFDASGWGPLKGKPADFVGGEGFEAAMLMDPDIAYQVGQYIYENRGGAQWTTWETVVEEMDASGKFAEKLLDDPTGKSLTWEEVAPYIAQFENPKWSETGDPTDILANVGWDERTGKYSDEQYAKDYKEFQEEYDVSDEDMRRRYIRNYDIGPYQINTRWLHGGIGSFEKNQKQVAELGFDKADQDVIWAGVQKILAKGAAKDFSRITGQRQKPLHMGKRKGFDFGDLAGKNSIWRNLFQGKNEFSPEFKNMYDALIEQSIIDEDFNMLDMGRVPDFSLIGDEGDS